MNQMGQLIVEQNILTPRRPNDHHRMNTERKVLEQCPQGLMPTPPASSSTRSRSITSWVKRPYAPSTATQVPGLRLARSGL